MPDANVRRELIEAVAAALHDRYPREGLAEFLRGRFGIEVDPREIRHKRAYLDAVLLDLPNADLSALARDIGVPGPLEKQLQPSESTSPPEGQLPSTWPATLAWVVARPQRLLTSLVMAIVIGAALVGTGRLLGYDVFASVFPRLAKVRTQQFTDPELQRCIDEAQKRGKAYVILSAVEIVEIRDSPQPNPTSRQATVRIAYTLLMLRDVSREENAEFFEAFTSDHRAVIERWYGSERETADAQGSSYDVLFTAKGGTTYTVITGATYNMPLPLPPGGSAFSQNTALGPNQDTWGYPNVIDGDVIRELTLVLWSPTTRLMPVGQSSKRVTNRTVHGGDAFVNDAPSSDTPAARSLSAHWYNVMPNEEVGIQFSW